MISPSLIKRNLIEFLQADVPLMAALSGTKQVKEADFQGQDFSYPAIRVTVFPQYPDGNGTSRLHLSQINWIVEVESEKPSSQEADRILGLVINAQFNKQWLGTDDSHIPNFQLIRVDLVNTQDATRNPMRVWVASATFQCQVNPLVSP